MKNDFKTVVAIVLGLVLAIYGSSIVWPSQEFINFIVGFGEGDGSWGVTIRGQPFCNFSQSQLSWLVLEWINWNVPLLKLTLAGTIYHLVATTKLSLYVIALIINGNLILPSIQLNFQRFLNALNKYIYSGRVVLNLPPIVYKEPSAGMLSLFTGWIAGFTQAEGSFSIWYNNQGNFCICFSLSQAGLINLGVIQQIGKLFGNVKGACGVSVFGKVNPVCLLRLCNWSYFIILFTYFAKFQLIGNKRQSLIKFIALGYRIYIKHHKIESNINMIRYEAQMINPYSKGRSAPYHAAIAASKAKKN